MNRHTTIAILVAALAPTMLLWSPALAQDSKTVRYLPKRGLPLKAEMVSRVDLSQITDKKVNGLLNAIGKAIPKESTDGHKMLDDFRKKAMPGILKGRDILYKAGIEQIVLPAEATDEPNEVEKQATPDGMDDQGGRGEVESDSETSDDGNVEFLLLKVRQNTTPAAAKKAFVEAATEGIKAAKPYLKEMQKNAKNDQGNGLTVESPTKDLNKQIATLEKDLKEMKFSRWEDGWVLVSQKDAEPNDPLGAGTKGLTALNTALARSKNAPIAVGYRLTDQARAKMIKGDMNNQMFGGLNAAAAQMNWTAGWLEMTDEPRMLVVVSFPTSQDATTFHGGVTKMIMFIGGLMAMGEGMGQQNDPNAAASAAAMQGLLADIAPAHSDKEVQFTITTTTLRKLMLLSAMQDDTDEAN